MCTRVHILVCVRVRVCACVLRLRVWQALEDQQEKEELELKRGRDLLTQTLSASLNRSSILSGPQQTCTHTLIRTQAHAHAYTNIYTHTHTNKRKDQRTQMYARFFWSLARALAISLARALFLARAVFLARACALSLLLFLSPSRSLCLISCRGHTCSLPLPPSCPTTHSTYRNISNTHRSKQHRGNFVP